MNEDEEKKGWLAGVLAPVGKPFAKFFRFIKDKIYDFSVLLHTKSRRRNRAKAKRLSSVKKSEIRFLWVLFIWPIICFFVGYVAPNINSFFSRVSRV